jgi:hypothetical protein
MTTAREKHRRVVEEMAFGLAPQLHEVKEDMRYPF